jgi:hypothetical protein
MKLFCLCEKNEKSYNIHMQLLWNYFEKGNYKFN